MRWAKLGTAKRGDCPGPIRLKARTTATRRPRPRAYWPQIVSIAALLAP